MPILKLEHKLLIWEEITEIPAGCLSLQVLTASIVYGALVCVCLSVYLTPIKFALTLPTMIKTVEMEN